MFVQLNWVSLPGEFDARILGMGRIRGRGGHTFCNQENAMAGGGVLTATLSPGIYGSIEAPLLFFDQTNFI